MSKGIFDNIFRNKRVLITGHTGFKGSWLSIWLDRLGAQVVGYALEPPTRPSLFEICGLSKKIVSVKGDIRDFKKLKAIFAQYRPQIVFHLAAQSLVRLSYKEPVMTYATNVMGTVNVIEVSRATSTVRVIVNVTSDKCYEVRHSFSGYKETDPMGGFDPYSSSKGCAELVSAAYIRSFLNQTKGKEWPVLASARAGNVIGGGDWAEDRLIPDCIKAIAQNRPMIIRSPEAIRPWQHVLEPLSGYLLLAQRLYQKGLLFSGGWNFGPKREARPVKWIVKNLVKAWDNKVPWVLDQGRNPYEAGCLKLNCTKAKTKLGWQPQWDLELALRKTIDWYKAYMAGQNALEIIKEQIREYEDAIKQKKGSVS